MLAIATAIKTPFTSYLTLQQADCELNPLVAVG